MGASKVLVFGVGSIGSVYLYQLQQAGCAVTAVCRSNFEAVQKYGFNLTSLRFGNQTYRPDLVVRSVQDCSHIDYDYILVCAKSFSGQKPSLADMLRPAIGPMTAIVLAQNGIAIEEEVAQAYPDHPIISCAVYLPAVQTAPGFIEYPEMLNLLELGTYPAAAPAEHKQAAEDFAQLMIEGGGDAKVHDDIQIARWSKLVLNGPWNPICALSLCTDGGFLLTSDFAKELVWECMMEIVTLAQKIGVPGVDENVAREKYKLADGRSKTGTGREVSMLQDVKSGREFEVEAILGNTVRLGRQQGVSMPRIETIYALLKGRLCSLMEQKSNGKKLYS